MRQSLFTLQNVKNNGKSGLTIALISIPLSISLAVVSGVNPIVGIITAIWAGATGALFGGSNYNIIGVTGALSSIIASYALTYGPQNIPSLAIASSVCIFIAYLIHVEKYLIFIPSSVIHGFTLGVALIIMLSQAPAALGLENLPKHAKSTENILEILKHLHLVAWPTLITFLIFFMVLSLLKKTIPSIPGAILISPIGIAIGYATSTNLVSFSLQTLGGKFGAITPHLFQFPLFSFNATLITPAIIIAFVAIIETLLAAKIGDVLTKTKHNSRKEIFGLGCANLVSGICGGIPTTAALARTSFNIKAGATSALSALLSSIFTALISFLLLSYFSYIPMAVIAAILVSVALGMIEQEHFIRLLIHDRNNFIIALLVAAIIVYEDAIVGILAGVVMALLLLINKLAESNYEISVHEAYKESPEALNTAEKQHILVYAFKGKLVYLNSQAHILRFQTDFTQYDQVILELQNLYYIDLDGIDALNEIIELLEKRGQTVYIIAPSGPVNNMLQRCTRYKALETKGFVVAGLQEILKQS